MKRVFFFLAPAFFSFSVFFLAFFAFPAWADSGTDRAWWDENWQSRARIEIENQAGEELLLGYTVSLTFDHASWVQTNQSLVNGDDIRIVYQPEEGGPVELDRVLEEGSSWDDPGTRILFSTMVVIPEGGTDNDYFLYFNNPRAGTPPANPENVFALFEDFEDLEILPFPKYEWCSGEWCRTDQYVFPQVSGDQAFSGSKSLKLTGPGSPAAVYLNTPLKDYTLQARFYTIDPATEVGLYFRGWEFSALYPLFAFFWGGYQLDSGRGLYLANSCRFPDCPFPRPEAWNSLEVKVVGRKIVETKFNGSTVWWFSQPEELELPDDQGNRVGFLYRFPWGQEPFPLYYDDLTLRRAVEREPILSLREEPQIPLPVPSLVSPENGVAINLSRPAFYWEIAEGEEGDSSEYQIEIAASSDFLEEEKTMAVVKETTFVPRLPFGEGEYFWRVRVVKGTKESEWSETWRFILDYSAPQIALVKKPESKTTETWARFAWSGEDNVGGDLVFSFRLDQENWSEFSDQTEVSFQDLTEGEHTFALRAKDEAGNLSNEASFAWEVETTLICLPDDYSAEGEEDETQPCLVLEITPQEKTIIKDVKVDNQDEGSLETVETIIPFSSEPEKMEVLGETTEGEIESGSLPSENKTRATFDRETWLLVLKMAGLSSLLVAVGYLTARFR